MDVLVCLVLFGEGVGRGSGRAVGSGKGGGMVQSCSQGKLWI